VIAPLPPASVTVRPTRGGWALLAWTVVGFLCAWEGAGVGYGVLGTFGGALVLVAAAAAYRHASALRVEAPPPTTAFAGERFVLDVAAANFARRAAAFDVVVLVDAPAPGGRKIGAFLARLAAGAETRIEVAYPTMRRGLHPQGTLELASTFPLGLWRCRLRFALPHEVLVLPRLGTLRRTKAPGARVRRGVGHGGGGRGDEQEVYGVRAWREGEGLRHVHWKLSARRGRRLVREFRNDPRPPVHVVLVAALDADTRKRRNSFEDAVSLAATLVERQVRHGHEVRLTILGRERRTIACRRGRAALLPVLRALAQVAPEFGADEAPDVATAARSGPGESTYVVRVAGGAIAPRARAGGDLTVFDVADGGADAVFDRRRRPGADLLVGARR
jgi:uncharacterized protein (DUF58 family)